MTKLQMLTFLFLFCLNGKTCTIHKELSLIATENAGNDTRRVACQFQNFEEDMKHFNGAGVCLYFGNTCYFLRISKGIKRKTQMSCSCLSSTELHVLKMAKSIPEPNYLLSMETQDGDTLSAKGTNYATVEATLVNGAYLGTGFHGNGLHLDGTADYVDLGFLGDSCLGNITLCHYGFTVAMWLLPVLSHRNQFYFANSEGNPTVGAILRQTNDGHLAVKVRSTTETWSSVSYKLEEVWTLVTVSWKPQDSMGVYINGCLHEEALPMEADNVYAWRKTTIGKNPQANTDYTEGVIDDFAFWERVLNKEEVMSVFVGKYN